VRTNGLGRADRRAEGPGSMKLVTQIKVVCGGRVDFRQRIPPAKFVCQPTSNGKTPAKRRQGRSKSVVRSELCLMTTVYSVVCYKCNLAWIHVLSNFRRLRKSPVNPIIIKANQYINNPVFDTESLKRGNGNWSSRVSEHDEMSNRQEYLM
jgi:hypothetical protein